MAEQVLLRRKGAVLGEHQGIVHFFFDRGLPGLDLVGGQDTSLAKLGFALCHRVATGPFGDFLRGTVAELVVEVGAAMFAIPVSVELKQRRPFTLTSTLDGSLAQ